MPELALHILDLVQNSISAGAKRVTVRIVIDREKNTLTLVIQDDGKGMTPEFAARVTSPFSTSRTTRKVGLGIAMLNQLASMCDGQLTIDTKLGEGTVLTAVFRLDHIDLPPMGDITGTVKTLLIANPEKPEFVVEYRVDDREFLFDTSVIRETLGGLPLNLPEIIEWIDGYLSEGIEEVKNPSGADINESEVQHT